MKAKFEVMVEAVKISRVKDDDCLLSGEFVHDGKDVKVKMAFASEHKTTFDSLFGDVGNTVTFGVLNNAQTTLVDHSEETEEE